MIKTLTGSLLALLLAACQSNPVATDYDTQTDFNRYQQYELVIEKSDDNSLMHNRLVNAVNSHIHSLGLISETKNNSEAVLIIKPSLLSQQRTQEPNTRGSIGMGSGGGGTLFGISLSAPLSSETIVNDVIVVVEMIDKQSSKVVWQGSYAFTVDTEQPEDANQMVDKAVADIFLQFPPGQ